MSAVYDCSKTSDIQTSVMAWYTDVMHEVKPITSGYRLALSYNLVHTTKALRPALSGNNRVFLAIRQVLVAWKSGARQDVPEKILYLLDHKYSQANLRGSALKGSDAQRVAILDTLGKQLGFKLGLASVECHVTGAADDDGGGYYGRRNCYWDEESERDDDMLGFMEICDTMMSLTNFVNLDGVQVADEIEISGTTKTIPDDLEESVRSGAHDEQEYEGYMGNGAGTLERWYRRTVLVIWPKFADCIVSDNPEDVCSDLKDEATSTKSCTPEQHATIEFLLNRRVGQCGDAVNVAGAVCHAACCWGDLELWKRTVQRCSPAAGAMTLTAEDVRAAITTFGFDAVNPSLDEMLRHEKRNRQLFVFLEALRATKLDQSTDDTVGKAPGGSKELAVAVSDWIVSRWSASLKTLRALSKEDFATISKLAAGNGGLWYIILPQLAQTSDASTLREFALYMNKEHDSGQDANSSLRQETVAQILRFSISKLVITLCAPPGNHRSYPYMAYSRLELPEPLKPDPSLEVAKTYFETCFTLNCPSQSSAVIAKVSDISGQPATDGPRRARLLMLPFLTWASEFIAKHPNEEEIPDLSSLHKAAIESILDDVATHPTTATREEMGRLLQTAALPGGMNIFVDSILPRLDTLASSEAPAKAILEELQPRLALLVMPASYQGLKLPDVMLAVAKKYAQCASIDTTAAVITAIDCCIRMQALDGVWTIFNRVLDPNKLKQQSSVSYSYRSLFGNSSEGSIYADTVVVPLMAQLRELALKHDMFDTFIPAFRQIARTYTQRALGPLPSGNSDKRYTTIRGWLCSCTHCKRVRVFLLLKPERSMALERIGAPSRKHVEGYLAQFVTAEGATWDTIRTSPQGLKVTKTDLLHSRSVWQSRQQKAKQLIKDVSPDEAERVRIYGGEYAEYAKWMKGVPASGATASQQRQPIAATPSTSTASQAVNAGVRRTSSTQSSQALPPAKRVKKSGTREVIDLTSP
ncbi:hypothetical protein EIP86_000356 [Pleurotus ostreatoroseus]|nr:hypothetical protein EIP86_000356 [Pleurotus ostreatoroseus]